MKPSIEIYIVNNVNLMKLNSESSKWNLITKHKSTLLIRKLSNFALRFGRKTPLLLSFRLKMSILRLKIIDWKEWTQFMTLCLDFLILVLWMFKAQNNKERLFIKQQRMWLMKWQRLKQKRMLMDWWWLYWNKKRSWS